MFRILHSTRARVLIQQPTNRPNWLRIIAVCAVCFDVLMVTALAANAEQGGSGAATRVTPGSHEDLLGTLQAHIADLTPDIVIESELVPGQMRLLGCDVPDVGTANLRQASHFGLTLYFECLPGIQPGFKRDILVSLGELDIARASIEIGEGQPGEVVKRELRLYVPRNSPTGIAKLSTGFLEDDAPGHTRGSLAPRLAPLLSARVRAAGAPSDIAPEQKQALAKASLDKERSGRNLLVNGRFEEGLRGWVVDEDLREVEGEWRKALSISIDKKVSLEGRSSLRIDFAGGRDPAFYHVRQEVAAKPSTEYVLSYFMKTEGITSNGLPGMMVRDPDKSADEFYVATPEEKRLAGTRDWTPVEFTFRTTPDTRKLRLHICRAGSGSRRYWPGRYGPIGGSVWYDFIQLTERQ